MIAGPIRVLIVDDSMFMRAAIKRTLEAAGGFVIVGQARDGEDAADKVVELQPDVVSMDYNMPRKNGAEAVREIMRRRPTPVIMFSAHTRQGARETFEALDAGAVDFCTKPHGEVSADLSAIADKLVAKLRVAAGATPRANMPVYATATTGPIRRPSASSSSPDVGRKSSAGLVRTSSRPDGARVVVIGISTGGPAALSRVIPALPADVRFATLVVQHMPPVFTEALAERLDAMSAVRVREAREGDRPMPGEVLIAPGGHHLDINNDGSLHITNDPPLHGCRPAADVTMKAAARVFGRRTVGVVMTGMGKDACAGMTAIKRADGQTLAQNQDTSVIFGMPKAAIEAGVIDEVVALDEIASRLRYL